MPTIADLHSNLRKFDADARKSISHASNPASALQRAWQRRFGMKMSNASAKSYVDYYRDMTYKQRMHGGNAPLQYSMGPGTTAAVYGRFPIDASVDPQSISNLDVYFNSAISKDCGVVNSSLTVPVEMGSNRVNIGGGSRRSSSRRSSRTGGRRGSKGRRSTYKKQRHSCNGRRGTQRRYRGGGFFDALTMRMPANISTPFPNVAQAAAHSYAGGTTSLPFPANPEIQKWALKSDGIGGIINPGIISSIEPNFLRSAVPKLWSTTN